MAYRDQYKPIDWDVVFAAKKANSQNTRRYVQVDNWYCISTAIDLAKQQEAPGSFNIELFFFDLFEGMIFIKLYMNMKLLSTH